METIAVYWEPVIRVYGFDIIQESGMIELDFPTEHAAHFTTAIDAMGNDRVKFIVVLLQQLSEKTTRITILLKQEFVTELVDTLKNTPHLPDMFTVNLKQGVDVLFYHGPHFQDRYGIAHATFEALDQSKINLLMTGCTGTSIYLIVEAGQADLAKQMLSESFVVPK